MEREREGNVSHCNHLNLIILTFKAPIVFLHLFLLLPTLKSSHLMFSFINIRWQDDPRTLAGLLPVLQSLVETHLIGSDSKGESGRHFNREMFKQLSAMFIFIFFNNSC